MHSASRASNGSGVVTGASERQGANDGTGITCLNDCFDAGNIG